MVKPQFFPSPCARLQPWHGFDAAAAATEGTAARPAGGSSWARPVPSCSSTAWLPPCCWRHLRQAGDLVTLFEKCGKRMKKALNQSVLHQVFSASNFGSIYGIYIYMAYIYTHGLHRFHMDLAHGENPSATDLPADAFSKRSADFSVCRSRSASMAASCRSLGSWGSKRVKRRVMVIRFVENINVYS